jgi:uncharacterized membrane protein
MRQVVESDVQRNFCDRLPGPDEAICGRAQTCRDEISTRAFPDRRLEGPQKVKLAEVRHAGQIGEAQGSGVFDIDISSHVENTLQFSRRRLSRTHLAAHRQCRGHDAKDILFERSIGQSDLARHAVKRRSRSLWWYRRDRERTARASAIIRYVGHQILTQRDHGASRPAPIEVAVAEAFSRVPEDHATGGRRRCTDRRAEVESPENHDPETSGRVHALAQAPVGRPFGLRFTGPVPTPRVQERAIGRDAKRRVIDQGRSCALSEGCKIIAINPKTPALRLGIVARGDWRSVAPPGKCTMLDSALLQRLLPYGLGVFLLGIVGIAFGDFALQWQPVPPGVPLRSELAYVCAAIVAFCAVALFFQRTTSQAALLLGSFFALWAAVLHLPRVLVHLGEIAVWNGLAEIGAAACGGWAAWVLVEGTRQRPTAARIVPRILGACLLVFGTAHFVYADFTASMVPKWIPGPLFWAYATGIGHFAAGLSLISGVLSRLAATLLTAMFASFVCLLHLPRVIASPETHMEWVMLAISTTLMGTAWLVRELTPEFSRARLAFS